MIIAFLSLGALAWVTYELGAHWFGPAAGAVAAHRDPDPHPGPELRRAGLRRHPVRRAGAGRDPGRGARPRTRGCRSSCSRLAGLLRPEAWLFSLAYVAWQARPPAAAARGLRPGASGWPTTSCWPATRCIPCSARATTRRCWSARRPRRRPAAPSRAGSARSCASPGCSARPRAACSCWPSCAGARRCRSRPGFVSIAAFCVLAAAGLPILGRYLLLPGRAARGVLRGGRVRLAAARARPPVADPLGGRSAAAVLAAFVVFAPGQIDRVRDLRASMGTQADILADLHDDHRRRRLPPGRGPEPPPGPARRALDRHPAGRDRLRPARAADAAACTSTRRPSASSATSRSTRTTRRAHRERPAGVRRGGGERVVAPLRALLSASETRRPSRQRKMDRAPAVEVGLRGLPASLTPAGRPRYAHR